MMKFKLIFILVLAIFVFCSCSIKVHQPSSPNIPILDSIPIFSTECSFTSTGIDIKPNLNLFKHVIIAGTFNFYDDNTKYNEGSLGAHYQIHNFLFAITCGYGEGIVWFSENLGGSTYTFEGKGKYMKYTLQPLIAVGTKKDQFGIIFKIAKIKYSIESLNGLYMHNTNLKLGKYYDSFSNEPSIFYRHNFDTGFTLTFYAGRYIFSSVAPISLHDLDHGILLGFGLGLNIKKDNTKRKMWL